MRDLFKRGKNYFSDAPDGFGLFLSLQQKLQITFCVPMASGINPNTINIAAYIKRVALRTHMPVSIVNWSFISVPSPSVISPNAKSAPNRPSALSPLRMPVNPMIINTVTNKPVPNSTYMPYGFVVLNIFKMQTVAVPSKNRNGPRI